MDGTLWARERGRTEVGWKFKMGLAGLKANHQQDRVHSESSRGEAIFLPSAPRVCLPPLIHGSLLPSSKPSMMGSVLLTLSSSDSLASFFHL